ncbi:response regulator transcription factor [bacterium]|nr:response regulator transcription factor [bacterium]
MTDERLVYIVDDDEAVRDSTSMLMQSVGLAVETYPRADAFLSAYRDDVIACLVLDVRMPGMSGTELQSVLKERGIDVPIIFITGHGDVPMAVNALQAGAVDFLQKPFRQQELLDRVNAVLDEEAALRTSLADRASIQQELDSLTPREQDVMRYLMDGEANKVIAIELGISERTVEIHRARVFEKLGVRNVARLVRKVMAARQGAPE